MSNHHYNPKHVMLGILILAIPIAALAYRFGLWNALLVVILVLCVYSIAKLAIYLFTRQSSAAKVASIALYPELVFVLFLPKHLKQGIANLKQSEQAPNK